MKDKKTYINEDIKSKVVNVINQNGEKIDNLSIDEALAMALESNLDLVQVGNQDGISVCKIMDYGKHLYDLKKKRKSSAKHLSSKEVYFRPSIDVADKSKKTNDIKRFLEKGHEVKVGIKFKGRELAHKEIGIKILSELKEEIINLFDFKLKSDISSQGRTVSLVFSPK